MADDRLRIKLAFDNGREVVVEPGPKDFVAFERQYDMSFGDFPQRIEHIYYMAWSKLHRDKQEPRAFDEYLDDLADAEVLGDEPAAPFDPAPTAEASPS